MTNEQKAAALLEETRRNGGLAPLDLDRCWADQALASKNPWGRDIPQMPMGIGMSHETVFDELGVEEDIDKYNSDSEWRLELHRAYNRKAEQIVGLILLGENPPDPEALKRMWPPVKALHDIFESWNEWHAGSWWLQQSAHDEDEKKRHQYQSYTSNFPEWTPFFDFIGDIDLLHYGIETA
jgi:hypothetical protein